MYAGYGMPRRARTTRDGYWRDGRRVKAQRLGGLAGESNCIDYCTRCSGPIFRDSRNAQESKGLHVDNTPKLKHRRCPKVVGR